MGGSEAIFSLESLSITDFLPHGNLDVLAKEDVASSKAKLRCPEGSPPEKRLSKGQRKERKEEGVEVGCSGASSEFDFA